MSDEKVMNGTDRIAKPMSIKMRVRIHKINPPCFSTIGLITSFKCTVKSLICLRTFASVRQYGNTVVGASSLKKLAYPKNNTSAPPLHRRLQVPQHPIHRRPENPARPSPPVTRSVTHHTRFVSATHSSTQCPRSRRRSRPLGW